MGTGYSTRYSTAGAGGVPALPPEIEYRAWNKDEHVVARVCGVSVQTVRRWRAAGDGPAWKKLGALVRYSLAGVFEWLESQPGGGGGAQ
jgi:predicted DNA-binding transcriptional regulator AlpA